MLRKQKVLGLGQWAEVLNKAIYSLKNTCWKVNETQNSPLAGGGRSNREIEGHKSCTWGMDLPQVWASLEEGEWLCMQNTPCCIEWTGEKRCESTKYQTLEKNSSKR